VEYLRIKKKKKMLDKYEYRQMVNQAFVAAMDKAVSGEVKLYKFYQLSYPHINNYVCKGNL
jgi:hypothetical protein